MPTAANIRNPAKESLKRGDPVLCMSIRLARTVDIALIAKEAGYDAFFVDMEHAQMSTDDAVQICVAGMLAGITPLVRVPCHDPVWMTRVLDGGAQGIVVPQVDTAEQARKIVAQCRFPPLGVRSVSGPGPLVHYRSVKVGDLNRTLDELTLIIVMIESLEALKNADEIAAVEGIDVLHIGSYDMTTALGIPGDFHNPKLTEAFEAVARACKKHGKTLGMGGIRDDPDRAAEFVRLGARFMTAGNDGAFALAGGRRQADSFRGIIKAGMV